MRLLQTRILYTLLLSPALFPILLAQEAITFATPTYEVGDTFEFLNAHMQFGTEEEYSETVDDFKIGRHEIHTILEVDPTGKATKVQIEIKEMRGENRRYKKGADAPEFKDLGFAGKGSVFEAQPADGPGNTWTFRQTNGEENAFAKSMTAAPKTLPFNLSPEHPTKPVKKGDSWELPKEHISGFMGDAKIKKGSVKFTFGGMVEDGGQQLAKITETVNITFTPAQPHPETAITMEISGTGTLLADPKTGMTRSRLGTAIIKQTTFYNGSDEPSIRLTPRGSHRMIFRKVKK